MTPDQELDAAVAANPSEAAILMLKTIFRQTAEIQATLETLVPVIGGIAGRLGIKGQELRDLTEMAHRG